MDPELAAALASAPPLPLPDGPPTLDYLKSIFKILFVEPFRAWQVARLPAESTYAVQDRLVPVEGGEITVRIVVPADEDPSATFPVLFNVHGGGLMFGDIDLDDGHLRRLCVDFRISVVNVGYRLLPGHSFSTPVNDSLAALKWTVENTPLLKADLSKGFILMGDSAGASISTVLAHEARDDPFFRGRQPTGQFLCETPVAYPSVYPEALKPEFRSLDENQAYAYHPFTASRAAFDQMIAMLNMVPSDPRCSPLLYPSHEGLPPTYIQAMGVDPLRDDAVVYEKVLREAGVKTKFDLYPGVGHGFHAQFPTIAIATKLWADSRTGLEWLLKGGA
ncbi:Alpha/Beta hydrolase protein [Trametes gibbosa]|nr:Alpha/Beta hydrolase protein [Trametes gibbosa]